MGVLLDKPDGIIEPDRYGKIKGDDVLDGVRFEVYITYHDELSDGDKLTHMTANKATIGYVIPRGFEPYTAFRPYEEISIPIAPSAILQRGTTSIKPTMCYYKNLIELKRKWYEILTGETWNDKQKRENTYMLKPDSISESANISSGLSPLMEDAFDLYKTDTGLYRTGGVYSVDDVVIPLPTDKKEADSIMYQFKSDDPTLEPNIFYDINLNALVALEPIYPGEILVLK